MAMTADDYDMIKMRSHNGSQRREDGADHYAENLRYDYLTNKDNVSFKQGTGVREVEESGSGRTRGLDTTNSKPGTP